MTHLPTPPPLQMNSLWQLVNWLLRPVHYLEQARRQTGNTFTVAFGWWDILTFTCDPIVVEAVLRQSDQLKVGTNVALLAPLLGENSLLTLEGDRHRQHRKLLMPPFHGERMKAYASVMITATEEHFVTLPRDRPVDVFHLMQQISFEVILKAIFGLKPGSRTTEVSRRLLEMLKILSSPLRSSLILVKPLQQDWGRWSPWGRMQWQRRQLFQVLQAEIDARRQQPEGEDILSLLMSAQDEVGVGLSDGEIMDEMLTFLIAGYETTAISLAWALYWVYARADVRERLRTELAGLGENPEPMAIARLPYLNAVCQEVLRWSSPAPVIFPRSGPNPVQLGPYLLPAQRRIVVCTYLLHRNPALYPQPEQFRPERFLDWKPAPYEFLPFGAGARLCIGYAFAQFELKLVLATVLQQYDLELVNVSPSRLARRGVNLAPQGGIPCRVTPRKVLSLSH
ncbi:MAG: cytochrome P450 [Spirulina sp. SIO3F2]|nr:cytochrome P450 [Spirulina sp. SIO3F2]